VRLNHALILDENRERAETLRSFLAETSCQIEAVREPAQAWEAVRNERPDVVFLDAHFHEPDAGDLIGRIREYAPACAVILMSEALDAATVSAALQAGAYDCIRPPSSREEMSVLFARLRERLRLIAQTNTLRHELAVERAQDYFITQDPQMLHVCEAAQVAATANACLLIQGEYGTGKETLARLIHEHSPRRDMPLFKLNCAALPDRAGDALLLGREPNAVSGAPERRIGCLELADGGTLLLREVSGLPLPLQEKLAVVLRERCFRRIGGKDAVRVNVRVIATTAEDLRARIAAGSFSQALYEQLNVIPLMLPPLRARKGDVEPLSKGFIKILADQTGRTAPRITPEAMGLLNRYAWPGNIRELKNLAQRLVSLSNGETVGCEHLPAEIQALAEGSDILPISVGLSLEDAERWLILKTLRRTEGNRTEAAEILGVTTRTLRNKLSRYRDAGDLDESADSRVEALTPDWVNTSHPALLPAILSGTPFAQMGITA